MAAVCVACGCMSRVVKPGHGAVSPTKQLRVTGIKYGAWGKSYYDDTPKAVKIFIVSHPTEKILVERTFKLTGSHVSWRASWCNETNVVVSFFDYGRGISYYDTTKSNRVERLLKEAEFFFDPATDTWNIK